MKVIFDDKDIIIKQLNDFDLGQTLECGQCFHFTKIGHNDYGMVAYGKFLHAIQKEDVLILKDTSAVDYYSLWRSYFDLNRDYSKIKQYLLKKDKKLKEAIEMMWGVHILNQEFFETLISFIISQNKQIPHIKQIVAQISKKYGKLVGQIGDIEFYSFPEVDTMYSLTEDELRACKTGFRAPYICDAVRCVKEGVILYENLLNADIKQCINQLVQIKGVGNKVANCVSLFGLQHREAFPVDVWIKRIVEYLYFDGKECSTEKIEQFGSKRFGIYGGYAQQYLFYYGKTVKMGLNSKKLQ